MKATLTLQLQEYNQEDFGPSPFKEGDLNGVAYAYIPSQCQDDPSGGTLGNIHK